MRPRALSRLLAVVTSTSVVVFGCAQIAGLDDPGPTSSSGTSDAAPNSEAGSLPDGVRVEPSELSIGAAACGVASKPAGVIIFNKGKNDLSYGLKSNESTFVVRGKLTGVIPPGQSERLEVVATPSLAREQRTPLVLTLNGVDSPYWASVLGEGPTFELSQTVVDFGDVRKQAGSKATVTVKNLGSKPLAATMTGSGDAAEFTITPTTISAPSDGDATFEVAMKGSTSTSPPLSATFKPNVQGVCGPLPELQVRGKRITTDVTIDTVDWGAVGCKEAPADRSAIVKNYGPAEVSFTAALSGGAGSAFQIVGSPSAKVGPGSESNPTSQQIGLKVLPSTNPGQRDETLTITYGGSSTSTGKVRASIFGLVLGVTPNTFAFNSDGGVEQTKRFSITNTGPYAGGAPIFPSYKTTGAGFRAERGTVSYYPFLGNTGGVDVVFKATQAGTVNGALTVEGPVCSQNAVTLTGNNP